MDLSILHIIPQTFRRRAYFVTLTIFLRALLNFIGLALMLPVLMLILDTESIHTNRYLIAVYDFFGFTSDSAFVITICIAVVVIISGKCLLSLALYKVERNYIYDLYSYMSRRLYIEYRNRGLLFIKNSNSSILARNVNVVCLIFVTGILKPIASIISEVMLFGLLFITLSLYNPLVALLILAIFVPAIWLYYGLVRNRLNRYGDLENRAHREMARTVIETFRGYSDIEINNAFPSMLDNFQKVMDEVVETRAKESTINTLPQMFTEIGLSVGMALLVVVNLNMEGDHLKILFGIFAVAALRLMPSIRNIMTGWTAIKYNKYTIEILREADLDHVDQHIEQTNNRLTFNYTIDICNLSFRFEESDVDVIKDFTLSICKGERIGIRGASGTGKTTLFNLLLGFYPPTSGEIRIDGTPLTLVNRRLWQNSIGYVSQNVFITDSTFLANIALGYNPETVDRERVMRAVEAAKLKEFIDSLPEGLDTKIGECGNRLSGGQRQRIGIARALYKQADILFFDEATSALDNKTEEEVNRSIEALSKENRELTIIVIAHRKSSLEYCDRIITIGEE
ncbi:MAG: ABC transporter ATP-binding protein [Alistipes sp.]